MEDFFTPVSKAVIAHRELLPENTLGKKLVLHSQKNNFPDISSSKIVIFGVSESRKCENYLGKQPVFDSVRKSFYALYSGNWHLPVADIGDIQAGETVEDTYFVIKKIVSHFIKNQKIPILLGGSQDLVYAVYRGYDNFGKMINYVNIDSRFDLGNSENPISNKSFVGKMVVDKPFNLFNYSNIGYQTYFNNPDEIDLIEKLYFDAYRLGDVTPDISIVEPVLRDADIVSIDVSAIKNSEFSYIGNHSPNGFDGKEICAIARYAGISNKVSSFGIFEIPVPEKENSSSMLLAQMLWYFIEGVNFRMDDGDFQSEKDFTGYHVPLENEILVFKKSNKTQRWWIELPFIYDFNNKLKSLTLLPCTYQDYENACANEIPERWYKAKQKNEL